MVHMLMCKGMLTYNDGGVGVGERMRPRSKVCVFMGVREAGREEGAREGARERERQR